MARLNLFDVLCYSNNPKSRATVRRYYKIYRNENNLAERCDNENCKFHSEPLIWNGKNLTLVLDHVNGQCNDNSPNNLRYLCPDCDSQLVTRGGGNIGRVQNQTEFGYQIVNRNGTRDAKVFPHGVSSTTSTGKAFANTSERNII